MIVYLCEVQIAKRSNRVLKIMSITYISIVPPCIQYGVVCIILQSRMVSYPSLTVSSFSEIPNVWITKYSGKAFEPGPLGLLPMICGAAFCVGF